MKRFSNDDRTDMILLTYYFYYFNCLLLLLNKSYFAERSIFLPKHLLSFMRIVIMTNNVIGIEIAL
jgi:hypothetical protein